MEASLGGRSILSGASGEANNTPICGHVNKKVDNWSAVYHHARMKVSVALRDARTAAGLTQRQVADMLGVTPQFISDIEQDRRALGEKYLPSLPPNVRIKVALAMMSEHQEAIARINSIPDPEAA